MEEMRRSCITTLDHAASRERFPEGVLRTRLAENGNLPSGINPILVLPQDFFPTVKVWYRSPGGNEEMKLTSKLLWAPCFDFW